MSTATSISFHSAETPPLPIHRFTVEQYHRLGELGVLSPDDRVELLEGWIVEKMNQRPLHGFVVGLLNQWLQQNLPAGWIGRCQLPITTERSEPEPDLAVVRGDHAEFRNRHPNGDDCRLLIEVADTSVEKDRAKATIYSSSGVDEYWIINLSEKQLERFTSPNGLEYGGTSVLQPTQQIETQIDDRKIRLNLSELFETE